MSEPFLQGIVNRRLGHKTEIERIEVLEKKIESLEKKLEARTNLEYVQDFYKKYDEKKED